jgi:Putative addiction module component
MSPILQDVKAAAIQLSPAERSELIEFLKEASFEDNNSIRAAWEFESRQRFAEMESGGVAGVSIDDVFRHRKSV